MPTSVIIRSDIATRRLSGTALFYALLIITLIGILLTALVSIWMYYRGAHRRDLTAWEHIEDVNSAFLYAQAQPGKLDREYYPFTEDTVVMNKRPWGYFELISCEADTDELGPITKTALIGRKAELRTCLEMLDTRKALALSGNSQLVGSVVVPRGGITTTTVNGIPFRSGQAVIGSSSSGGGTLPALDRSLLSSADQSARYERRTIPELTDSFRLSYTQLPIVIKGKVLELDRQNWSGPILLTADSLIRIGKNARLDGLLLKAPSIEIDTGFTGRLQAIAEQEITLGTAVVLDYPSVLAIVPKGGIYRPRPGRLRIGRGSEISGTLLGLKPNDSDDQQLLATLQETVIRGRIIWQGGLEFSGRVAGGVYCDNFFYRSRNGQFFFNYLVNGRIDAPARSEHWVEPLVWQTGAKAIAQWLD